MILITICARGGSKGIKNKNTRLVFDKPLIQHTIEHAQGWGKANEIVVSTDCEDIKSIATSLGVTVPFKRPDDLSTDEAGKLAVIRHAHRGSESFFKKRFDTVIDLDVTAPLRDIQDIENAYRKFQDEKRDVIFSVVEAHRNPYFNMVEVNDNNGVNLSKELKENCLRRQDAPIVYAMNASIYVYRREFLEDITKTSIFGSKSGVYEMPEESIFDIDRPIDLKLVEFFMKERAVNAAKG